MINNTIFPVAYNEIGIRRIKDLIFYPQTGLIIGDHGKQAENFIKYYLSFNNNWHEITFNNPHKNIKTINENAILLNTMWCDTNYCHFTRQSFAFLLIAARYNLIDKNTILILPKLQNFHKELISLYSDIYFNPTIMEISKDDRFIYKFTNVLTSDFLYTWCINPEVINTFHHFRNFFITDNHKSEKIFINRRSKLRVMRNQERVNTFLKDAGYQIVYFEDYSVLDQIKICYSANDIVALHGASGANFIYCQPGVYINEIFSNGRIDSCNAQVAFYNNCFYNSTIHNRIDNTNNDSSYIVDIEVLKRSLNKNTYKKCQINFSRLKLIDFDLSLTHGIQNLKLIDFANWNLISYLSSKSNDQDILLVLCTLLERYYSTMNEQILFLYFRISIKAKNYRNCIDILKKNLSNKNLKLKIYFFLSTLYAKISKPLCSLYCAKKSCHYGDSVIHSNVEYLNNYLDLLYKFDQHLILIDVLRYCASQDIPTIKSYQKLTSLFLNNDLINITRKYKYIPIINSKEFPYYYNMFYRLFRIELIKEFTIIFSQFFPWCGEPFVQLSLKYEAVGNLRDAILYAKYAFEIDPGNLTARKHLSNLIHKFVSQN